MVNLDELDRLHAAATPGPWSEDSAINPSDVSIWQGGDSADESNNWIANMGAPFCLAGVENPAEQVNAQFVVALRNAWPALSAELRTRRKQVEEARRALETLGKGNRSPGVLAIARAALASLESGEPRHE